MSSIFSWSVVSEGGAATLRTNERGCCAKVTASVESPLSRAAVCRDCSTCWCPRCTPSKKPTVHATFAEENVQSCCDVSVEKVENAEGFSTNTSAMGTEKCGESIA